jgi:hypothetical protein
MHMDRYRERRWIRALEEAQWLSGQPTPPPRIAFMGVGAGIIAGIAFLLALLFIYGARTAESKIAFGLGWLILAFSIGLLISGFNQQRRRVFSIYTAGVDLIAGLDQIARLEACERYQMDGDMAEITLDRLEFKLTAAGAYREATRLHVARVGAGGA